jgi:hypothetical protein
MDHCFVGSSTPRQPFHGDNGVFAKGTFLTSVPEQIRCNYRHNQHICTTILIVSCNFETAIISGTFIGKHQFVRVCTNTLHNEIHLFLATTFDFLTFPRTLAFSIPRLAYSTLAIYLQAITHSFRLCQIHC